MQETESDGQMQVLCYRTIYAILRCTLYAMPTSNSIPKPAAIYKSVAVQSQTHTMLQGIMQSVAAM